MAVRARLGRPQSVAGIFAGLIDPAPKPEYAGVRMRSRLETDFARHLDAEGIPWTYEPALYGSYLPDFQLTDGGAPTFVEVKPRLRDVPGAKRRMRAIWKAHPDAVLVVACAEGSSFFMAVAGSGWASWVARWAH